MVTENTALAILEVPYRSYEGHKAPAQAASVIDPRGVLRDLTAWMSRMADGLDLLPEPVGSGAAATLRRGAASYAPLIGA